MKIENIQFGTYFITPKRVVKRFTRRYKQKNLFLEEDLIFLEDLDFKKRLFFEKKGIKFSAGKSNKNPCKDGHNYYT